MGQAYWVSVRAQGPGFESLPYLPVCGACIFSPCPPGVSSMYCAFPPRSKNKPESNSRLVPCLVPVAEWEKQAFESDDKLDLER